MLGNTLALPSGCQLTVSSDTGVLPEHRHDNAYIAIPVTGSYWETGSLKRNYIERGSCLLHPAGDNHQNVIGRGGSTILNIEIPVAIIQRHYSNLVGEKHQISLDSGRTRLSTDLLQSIYGPGISDYPRMDDQILQLLAAFDESRPRPSSSASMITEVDRHIRENIDQTISVCEIAERFNCDPVWLSRRFKRSIGISLKGRITEQRLINAISLVSSPRLPLSQVALRCGFYDQSHFNRFFKQSIGLTPGDCRSLHSAPGALLHSDNW